MMTDTRTLVFDDPRFSMTVFGRAFVRVARSAAGLLATAATVTFLISDSPQLFWFGVFLCLVLADGLFHSGEGERSLAALSSIGTVHIAPAFDRRALRILEDAFDRSTILGRDFSLQVAIQLAHVAEGGDLLRKLDISPEEFRQKAEEMRDSETGRAARRDREADLRTVAILATKVALRNGASFVKTGHLFAAVLRLEHPLTARLAEAFALAHREAEQALGFIHPPEFRSADAPAAVVRAYRVLVTTAVGESAAVDGDTAEPHDE